MSRNFCAWDFWRHQVRKFFFLIFCSTANYLNACNFTIAHILSITCPFKWYFTTFILPVYTVQYISDSHCLIFLRYIILAINHCIQCLRKFCILNNMITIVSFPSSIFILHFSKLSKRWKIKILSTVLESDYITF